MVFVLHAGGSTDIDRLWRGKLRQQLRFCERQHLCGQQRGAKRGVAHRAGGPDRDDRHRPCGQHPHRSGCLSATTPPVAAAVLLDADGKLAGVTLDELELSVSADSTGKVTTPTDTRTKRQKGKDYPLAEVSGLKKGWAEQADAFGSWLEGKTPDEVKKLKTDADGKPTEADLLSGCTIAVDRYRDAVVRACENAQVLGAARGDTVKLGVEVAEMPQGLAGTDDKDAQVQAKITLAVVTMDENARVTSAIGDMTEPELSVSADGTVSAPREPVYTKNELGDRYGMRSASALGKEWYEHSAGWCGYLKGKNAVEIGKLSADGTDADLKALCTISVTDLQKAALKAMAEQ